MPDPLAQVARQEVLFRKLLLTHYSRKSGLPSSPEAFKPIKADTDGLSMIRQLFTEPMGCVRGKVGKKYWVAELEASSLIDLFQTMNPDPTFELPGHCLVNSITYQRPLPPKLEEVALALTTVVRRVHGPFEIKSEGAFGNPPETELVDE